MGLILMFKIYKLKGMISNKKQNGDFSIEKGI